MYCRFFFLLFNLWMQLLREAADQYILLVLFIIQIFEFINCSECFSWTLLLRCFVSLLRLECMESIGNEKYDNH